MNLNLFNQPNESQTAPTQEHLSDPEKRTVWDIIQIAERGSNHTVTRAAQMAAANQQRTATYGATAVSAMNEATPSLYHKEIDQQVKTPDFWQDGEIDKEAVRDFIAGLGVEQDV